MSRRTGWLLAVAILIGSLALAALMVSRRPEPERRPAPSPIPFAATAAVEAGEGAIAVHGAGTVRPTAEIGVAAQVSGKVVWVEPGFQSGGRVSEGQALFRVEDADYRSRVEQARAQVALQRLELLKVTEEAEVARTQYERFRQRQAGDDGGDDPDANPLALWQPQTEAAKAALARDWAILEQAKLDVARTEIRAPFTGVVRSESVDVGQFVATGQEVARLYASDAVEVVVPLSDREAALLPGLWELAAGDPDRRIAARVLAEYGDDEQVWDGYVDRAEASLDEQTRTIDVIVRVPGPFAVGAGPSAGDEEAGDEEAGDEEAGDEEVGDNGGPPLLVGKFVDVELAGVAPERYFKLRRSALRPGNEVWAIRDGRVTIVPVRVLQRSDDTVFVTGGLDADRAVVVGGIAFATEGMAVRTETEAGP